MPRPVSAAEAAEMVERARRLDRLGVARLVSLFQDRRADAPERRAAAIALLDGDGERRGGGEGRRGTLIGITGTPGSGKSSLLGGLAGALLGHDPDLTVAVVAVDPSSHLSGGSLLGDRTRLPASDGDSRLYFRSEASDTALGGLSPSTFQVCRLLVRLFDCVFVETVGIGQSEADVRHLADRLFLVLSPLGGDEVQFLKAGIIEIPDEFVVNKCDEPAAAQSFRQLRRTLSLARPFDRVEPPVHRTSATTGEGIEGLADAVRTALARGPVSSLDDKETHFFERWVRDEWGRVGVRHLDQHFGGAALFVKSSGGFDQAQAAFPTALLDLLRAT
jgi:LAO/AO transport system kinase